jgi:hypothetical protein
MLEYPGTEAHYLLVDAFIPQANNHLIRLGVGMPDEIRLKTQERAYTSPIWYTP